MGPFSTTGKDELIRCFTRTSADVVFLRKFRRAQNVLATAVQLSASPWIGIVPDDLLAAPQLRLAAELAGYGECEQTQTDQLRRSPSTWDAPARRH